MNHGCAQQVPSTLAAANSGRLLAHDRSTLAQVGGFNASPKPDGEGKFGSVGGIWMGGGGLVADSDRNVYASTENGICRTQPARHPRGGTMAFDALNYPNEVYGMTSRD